MGKEEMKLEFPKNWGEQKVVEMLEKVTKKKSSANPKNPDSEGKDKERKRDIQEERKIKIVQREIQAEATTSRAPSRARLREIEEFFELCAWAVRQNKLDWFWPVGRVPDGGAVILRSRIDGKWRFEEATSNVRRKFGILSSRWMDWEEIPAELREALEEYKRLVQGLGYSLSPLHLGLAKELLTKGQPPPRYLCIGFTKFEYEAEVQPFGMVVIPVVEGGKLRELKIERIYNPGNLPDCPAPGSLLTLEEIKKEGLPQKAIKTQAKMERGFLSRYNEGGYPRPRQPDHAFQQRPVQSRRFR